MGAVIFLAFRWLLASLSIRRLSPTCHDSVSHPRSSNRTCGTIRIRLSDWLLLKAHAGRQVLSALAALHQILRNTGAPKEKPTDTSRRHLVPFNQKTSDAVVYVPLHRPIRNHRRAIAKVSAPTPQKRVQPISYIFS